MADELWGGREALCAVLPPSSPLRPVPPPSSTAAIDGAESDGADVLVASSWGEMPLPPSVPHAGRLEYYETIALEVRDPRAQHSLGLLLWNGFCTGGEASRDADASARWHAAAAAQGHLDAVAVLGGCLRTGAGVPKRGGDGRWGTELGIRCIEYVAGIGNPTGINKKAALLESGGDYHGAARLYESCVAREGMEEGMGGSASAANALLLFNLGWCLVNGEGTPRDVARGEGLWRMAATDLAPDEGSEEAAWFLSLQYEREDPQEAARWGRLAAILGYDDAIDVYDPLD